MPVFRKIGTLLLYLMSKCCLHLMSQYCCIVLHLMSKYVPSLFAYIFQYRARLVCLRHIRSFIYIYTYILEASYRICLLYRTDIVSRVCILYTIYMYICTYMYKYNLCLLWFYVFINIFKDILTKYIGFISNMFDINVYLYTYANGSI